MNSPGQRIVNFNWSFSLYSTMLVDADRFSDFATLILYYSTRVLSHDSDILRGAQGMLRRYTALNKTTMIEGLPYPLDQSLLFLTVPDAPHPMKYLGLRRKNFPSYSWTGWRSVTNWEAGIVELLPATSSNSELFKGQISSTLRSFDMDTLAHCL